FGPGAAFVLREPVEHMIIEFFIALPELAQHIGWFAEENALKNHFDSTVRDGIEIDGEEEILSGISTLAERVRSGFERIKRCPGSTIIFGKTDFHLFGEIRLSLQPANFALPQTWSE